MNLSAIQKQVTAEKESYWKWFINISPRQADILLAFAKDAFDQEAKRGDQIDAKGNALLITSLAILTLAATVAKPALDRLSGCALPIIFGVGIAIVILNLIIAMICTLWAIRVNRSWFPPNPKLILREEVITDDDIDLSRDLVLHYLDNVRLNRFVDDNKARLLKRGQAFLLAGVALGAFVGLCRMCIV